MVSLLERTSWQTGGKEEGRGRQCPVGRSFLFFVRLGVRRVGKGQLGRRNLIPYLAKNLPSTREERRVAQPRMWWEAKIKLAGRAAVGRGINYSCTGEDGTQSPLCITDKVCGVSKQT